MSTPHHLPDAVQWAEGLLLSPQHLQQNDRYWHEHLRHRLGAVDPHYWGVRKIAMDPSAMVKGVVSITRLECVLPDAQAVVFPGNYGADALEVDVDKLARRDGRPVRIWLRVHERGDAAARHDNANRRYDSVRGAVTPDENTGEGDIEVARLRLRLELCAEDATLPGPAGMGVCPLLEVARNAEGHLRLTPYHPPMLRQKASQFQGDDALHRRLDRLLQRTWSKVEELAGGRADDQPADDVNAPHAVAARHLATALPQLEIAVHDAEHRPADLYRALAQLVGQAACIGTNPVPLKMKPYRHHDCMPQFQAAFDYIEAKLALVNSAYELRRFVPLPQPVPEVGRVRFAYSLPADQDGELIVELQKDGNQTADDLLAWLQHARIVSRQLIGVAHRHRLRGAEPALLGDDEARARGLQASGVLFRLDNRKVHVEGQGAQDAFSPGAVLLIHGPDDRRRPAAILLHRRKRLKPQAESGATRGGRDAG